MREERHPGDLREEGASSARPVLIVAGIIAGIAVLICGGVAGHVAWTDAHRVSEESKKPEIARESAEAILRKIVKIDVPADMAPIESNDRGMMKVILFGRKSSRGFALQLAKADFSMAPPGVDRAVASPMLTQMLEMESKGPGVNNFMSEADSPETTRVLTVLGEDASFRFSKGRLVDSQEKARKVIGMFWTETGMVGVACVIPENEYDEDAFVRLIESIGPAEADAANESGPG